MTNAKELKRLTQEEEGELLKRASAGDKEATEILRLQYWPLVLRAAHQLHLGTLREDSESVAAISLLEAMRTYNPEMGVPFAAYAKARIFSEVKTYFRRERGRWNREILPFDTEEGDSFWDNCADPGKDMENLELKSTVEEALSKLPPLERELVEDCLIYGRKTQKDLAVRDSVSFQSITRRKRRAIKKLEGLRQLLMGNTGE